MESGEDVGLRSTPAGGAKAFLLYIVMTNRMFVIDMFF